VGDGPALRSARLGDLRSLRFATRVREGSSLPAAFAGALRWRVLAARGGIDPHWRPGFRWRAGES